MAAHASTVWIVEDSPLQMEQARRVLESHHVVVPFGSGEEMLERLSGAIAPDVLLLDWQLPGISGLEICSFVRSRYDEVKLPILMVSGRHADAEGDFSSAFAAGVNDFLAKPFHPTELVARVRSLVRVGALGRQRAQSEDRLRLVTDALPVLISFVDEHERYGLVNKAYEDWFGWKREELLGRTLLDVIGPAAYAVLRPYIARGLAGERFTFEQHGVPYRKGGARDIRVTYTPHVDTDGRRNGFVALLEDITERRKLEIQREVLVSEVAASRAHLRRVVEAAGAGTWSFDVATERIDGDNKYHELLGFEPGQRVSLPDAFARIRAEHGARVRAALESAIAGESEGRYFVEYVVHDESGTPRWLEERGQATQDEAGRPLRVEGTTVDITARKLAEAAREELLRAIDSQASLFLSVVQGPDLVLTRATTAFHSLFAHGRSLLGRPLREAYPDAGGETFDRMHRVMETGEPFIGREVGMHVAREPGGVREERYFNVVHQPVLGNSGERDSVLTIGQEVTDSVVGRLDAQRQATLQSERADFERQLIGIVSHDLRNPLTAISLTVRSLLRRSQFDPQTLQSLGRIDTSTGRALRMVGDLLDFTQARLGGGIPLALAECDIHPMLEQVSGEVRAAFPTRTIELRTAGDGRGRWDLERLAQVIQNLLTNALKYSPPRSKVEVHCRDEGEELSVSVHNEGEPIAAAALANIFQPMQRASTVVDQAGRSVGLGLFIVRHLVEGHGGRISVTSTESEGTTFRFSIPRARRDSGGLR